MRRGILPEKEQEAQYVVGGDRDVAFSKLSNFYITCWLALLKSQQS